MEMNRIEGGRIPGQIPASDPQPKGVRKAAGKPPAAGDDQIEFSRNAREAAEGTSAQSPRDAIVEAARAKLESGELSTEEAYKQTAEKLLKSGKLGKPGG